MIADSLALMHLLRMARGQGRGDSIPDKPNRRRAKRSPLVRVAGARID
jgi:hypothetical protein